MKYIILLFILTTIQITGSESATRADIKSLDDYFIQEIGNQLYLTMKTGPVKILIGHGPRQTIINDIQGHQYLIIGNRPKLKINNDQPSIMTFDDFGVTIKVISESICVNELGTSVGGYMGSGTTETKLVINENGIADNEK